MLDNSASHAHPAAREVALETPGGLTYWLADMTATTAAYQESLALARANGDPARISNALYNLSFLAVWGATEKTIDERATIVDAELEEALALALQVGDSAAIARCLWAMGNTLAYLRKDYAAALGPLAEAIPISARSATPSASPGPCTARELPACGLAISAAARAAFDEQVALLGDARDPSGLAIALSQPGPARRRRGGPPAGGPPRGRERGAPPPHRRRAGVEGGRGRRARD